jgi:glycosyltransferase involved in cell wall biosynthesis
MPSNYETYGMVAREAGVSGIPVICTPTDGLKENLGEAGIYVDYRDIDGYEKAIRELYDPKAYTSASKAIKDHIRHTTHDDIKPLLEELKNANQ